MLFRFSHIHSSICLDRAGVGSWAIQSCDTRSHTSVFHFLTRFPLLCFAHFGLRQLTERKANLPSKKSARSTNNIQEPSKLERRKLNQKKKKKKKKQFVQADGSLHHILDDKETSIARFRKQRRSESWHILEAMIIPDSDVARPV